MKNKLLLSNQPYDAFLLDKSRLYRKSRELFKKQGGTHIPAMLSSARSLSSDSLVKNVIEYSPVGSEIDWSLKDRIQKKDKEHLSQIRQWLTGVYHEQNHRILWKFFDELKLSCPTEKLAATSFLNFSEALVIIMDMALADELDSGVASRFYSERVIYNSGSPFMKKLGFGNPRYLMALQVCLHATYLRLEGLHPEDIGPFSVDLFDSFPVQVVEVAVERALKLEPRFVDITNPTWQRKNLKKVIELFASKKGKTPLTLPYRAPLDFQVPLQISELWLNRFFL